MSAHDTPRAFPSAAIDDAYGGMPLLDWFAGQALAGLCAIPEPIKGEDPEDIELAQASYAVALAMMEVRIHAHAMLKARPPRG